MADFELDTGWERYRLPVLLTGGLVLYGASRFDATRPVAGVLLTYGFPIIAVLMGTLPLRETSMMGSATVVGGVAVVAAEFAVGHARAPEVALFGLLPPSVVLAATVLSALGAAVVQALAASRGIRNLFSAWIGMVAMLALYMPTHAKVGRDSLDAFVAALLVSLFVGGGAGMLLGGLATKVVKPAKVGSVEGTDAAGKKAAVAEPREPRRARKPAAEDEAPSSPRPRAKRADDEAVSPRPRNKKKRPDAAPAKVRSTS